MELISGVFSAFGLSASAGLNAYIPLLVVSLLARYTDLIKLSAPWDSLTSVWVITLLIILVAIEFFVDKVPAVNHINDLIQTFVRPVAGAILFAASAKVITEIHPVLSIGAGILVAGGVHAVKTVAVRPVVAVATAGTGNVPVSVAEDVASTVTSLLAIIVPLLLGVCLIIFSVWLFFYLRSRKNKTIEQKISQY